MPTRRTLYNRAKTMAAREGGDVADAAGAARGSILCVFAHPDDESFGIGGALAAYAAQGVAVDLLCTTPGQGGQLGDPPWVTRENLGAVREAAVREAGRLLGLREVTVLKYMDGAMRDAPYAPLLAEIMETYRRVRPTTVITFGPTGISGHPDHIVTHRAATEAFWRLRGELPALRRLYYPALPPRFRRPGAAMGPVSTSPETTANTEIAVPPEAFAAQLAALAKHGETQRDAREHRAMLARMKPACAYFYRVEPPVAPYETDRGLLP